MDFANVKAWLSGAWRSRTMWAATGLGLFGIAQTQLDVVRSLIKPHLYGVLTIGVAVGVGVLRAITSASIIGKAPSDPSQGA
jgi:hypothetical protein